MKKMAICLLAILFINIIQAQTLDRLDKNNGFRKFKFGMSSAALGRLTNYQTSIKQKDVKIYTYAGGDVTEFNGIRIEKINLGFYRDRLYIIQVSFGTIYKEYTSAEFEIVQSGLESNFGHSFHQCNEDNNSEIINCAIWDGARVRVESLRLNQTERNGTQNRMFNYIQGYMLFTDKTTELEQQRGEMEN